MQGIVVFWVSPAYTGAYQREYAKPYGFRAFVNKIFLKFSLYFRERMKYLIDSEY